MALDPQWLEAALGTRLPRKGKHANLSLRQWNGFAGFPAERTGSSALGLWACLHLGPGEGPSGSTSICPLILPEHVDQPQDRVLAYLLGWLSAVDFFLAHAERRIVEHAIPMNLVHADVLGLKRPQVPDDFKVAVLAARRLGKLLGDPVAAMRSLDAGRS